MNVSKLSLLFVNNEHFFPVSVVLQASVVHHECFTADISAWSALAFHSSCLVTAVEIVQQANCEFIVLLLLPPWPPEGEEPLLAISAIAEEDLLLYHLLIHLLDERSRGTGTQVVLEEGLGWHPTIGLPHQGFLSRYMSCTAFPTAKRTRWRKNGKRWLAETTTATIPYKALLFSCETWKEQTRRDSWQNILHKISAWGLLCSGTATLHETATVSSLRSSPAFCNLVLLQTAKIHSTQQLCSKTGISFIPLLHWEGSFALAAPSTPGLKELMQCFPQKH